MLPPEELLEECARLHGHICPGQSRVVCASCGESVNDGREVFDGLGRRVCKSCAFGSYYRVLVD